MQSLLSAVGEGGTLLNGTFTESFWRFNVDRSFVFCDSTPSTSGALSKSFLSWPGRIRSKHPTNSFTAIGKQAATLVEGHDHNSLSYEPIGRAIDLNCKMLLIGCVDKRNGVASVHYAQETLGLTRRNLFSGSRAVLFEKNGKPEFFVSRSGGGCSRGFWKFYSHFVTAGALMTGQFGDAYSVLIDGRKAYEITVDILRRDPKFALCDDPNCFSCRGTWLFNKTDMPSYYARNSVRLFGKAIQALLHR
jgi:aminoglycoside N3'-acetyltransferase